MAGGFAVEIGIGDVDCCFLWFVGQFHKVRRLRKRKERKSRNGVQQFPVAPASVFCASDLAR